MPGSTDLEVEGGHFLFFTFRDEVYGPFVALFCEEFSWMFLS
jgi:hypothetical protein